MTYFETTGLRRREMLGIAAGCMINSRANAIALIWGFVLPSAVAGLFAMMGIREQALRDAKRHQDDLQLGKANLQLAREQLLLQKETMLRQERMQVLQALLSHGEISGEISVGQGVRLAQTIIANLNASSPSTRVLSENLDGAGTRVGLVDGCLAVERAGHGSMIDNSLAVDLGMHATDRKDPLAVATSAFQRDLNDKLAKHLFEVAGLQWHMPADAVEKQYSIAGTRLYSRARQPRGNPDIQAALFVARKKGEPVRYAYIT